MIKSILEKLNNPMKEVSIAVAGDFGLDVFVYGSVNRISPEAPVPVLLKEKEEIRLGLAGNVVANLAALKEGFPNELSCFGVIAPGKHGYELNSRIEKIAHSNLIWNSERKTTVKTRLMAGNHQLLRVDSESTENFTAPASLTYFKEDITDFDVLILQDYGKGFLNSEIIREFIKIARENNILIITDPNVNSNPYNYSHSTIITPNVKEAKTMLRKIGYSHEGANDVPYMCQLLKYNLKIDNVLITESANGMTLLDKNDEIHNFPALCKDVRDVTGAGDTVVAALALAIANEFSIQEACWIASAAASVVVKKQGTSTVNLNEIKEELKNHD